jgi:hypothetical protein
MRLGANAYLIKLNRGELLKTLEEMLATGIERKP